MRWKALILVKCCLENLIGVQEILYIKYAFRYMVTEKLPNAINLFITSGSWACNCLSIYRRGILGRQRVKFGTRRSQAHANTEIAILWHCCDRSVQKIAFDSFCTI